MAPTLTDKGKRRALPKDLQSEKNDAHWSSSESDSSSDDSDSDSSSSSSSNSDSDSSSDSSPDSESESGDDIGPEFLESLLAQARANARAQAKQKQPAPNVGQEEEEEEDFIRLDSDDDADERKKEKEQPLPPLDTSSLPAPYITLSDALDGGPPEPHLRDPDVDRVHELAAARSVPATPPPPTLSRDGKKLTKKELKKAKNNTAGPAWFDLPAPPPSDLPRLHREVEALRLHKQLDPKHFYRKDPGEGKGIKGLPQHFAIGTVLPTDTPFGSASATNLPRAGRKRTLVDALVDDADARRYAKKKFRELQGVRGARGRGTLAAKSALRKPKW